MRFRTDVWERTLRDFASPHVFAFTLETTLTGSDVHCRMFAPAFGIAEDPATGAANGPLGCYLVRHGLVKSQDGVAEINSEQGFEMGRPSLIQIRIEHEDKQIMGVYVGGQCHLMGEGYLNLDL